MNERTRRVVLLIDYDNLQICASRDTPGRDLQLTPVVQLAQRYGTVILARAYAEWNLSTERLAVYKAGIEPAFAPVLRTESDRSGKSLADTVMVAEGMDMLWTLSPEVVVLATSDKDLIPLVRVAKQRGAFVVVLGSDFTAIPLREMADDHFTYRQLITDTSGGRFATEAGPGRQPAALPEPARRRSRDRSGRERTGTATSSATGTRTEREASGRPERESAARPEREGPAARPEREGPAGRPEREGAGARPEREGASAAAGSGAPAAEAVAPVTAGTAAEGDAQVGTRRRRRRGSRRRSERIGQPGEGGTTGVSEAGTAGDLEDDGIASADTAEEPGARITPTTSAAEVARASRGTVETPADETPAAGATDDAGKTATEDEAKPARERRRRTRRSPAGTETASDAEAGAAPARSESTGGRRSTAARTEATETPAVPPPTADVVLDLPAAPAPAAPEDGQNGETPPATRRPRRIASASRGRSRPPGSR